jgi:uncharacterized lipoprotein YmbA
MLRVVRTAGTLISTALLGVMGCVSLGRDAPALEQYVLSARTAPVARAPDASGMTIGLRRLDLAPYLATPSIVVRRGAHQIMVSDFHRWGEDLGEGINRTVASHLAAAASVRAVHVAPWPVGTRHDYLVQLHVTRFEGVADTLATEGHVQVLASWEIIRPPEGAVVAQGGTDYRRSGWRVGDYAGLVMLLEGGLDVLAGDLVSCLGRLGPPAASPPRADVTGSVIACPTVATEGR